MYAKDRIICIYRQVLQSREVERVETSDVEAVIPKLDCERPEILEYNNRWWSAITGWPVNDKRADLKTATLAKNSEACVAVQDLFDIQGCEPGPRENKYGQIPYRDRWQCERDDPEARC